MLPRATRIQNLLLMRAPPCGFLLQGPPRGLQKELLKFAKRTADGRKAAEALIAELGFAECLN